MSANDDLNGIIGELKKARRAGRIDDSILTRLADVVEPVLRNPPGPIQSDIADMWRYVKTRKSPWKSAFTAFVTRRNSPREEIQRIWWLQLLFTVTQAFATQGGRLIPGMKGIIRPAAQARGAWKKHVRHNGVTRVIGELIEAIEHVQDVLPKATFLRLDGDHLVYYEQKISTKLTSQELTFMTLLLRKPGKPVSATQLKSRHVNHPVKLRSRMVSKPVFAFLKTHITAVRSVGFVLQE